VSGGKFTLDFVLPDPPEYRDGFVDELYSAAFRARQAARDREVDELIAMGWGGTQGRLIPENWREVRGPDSEARRAAIRVGVECGNRARARARKRKWRVIAGASEG
jgi:hypothetical protein